MFWDLSVFLFLFARVNDPLIVQGFLSDDTVLAGALWRNLYMQRSVDPIHLNRAVYYVRGTVCFNYK